MEKRLNKNVEQWIYSKSIIFAVFFIQITTWFIFPNSLDIIKEHNYVGYILLAWSIICLINTIDLIGYIGFKEGWRDIVHQKRIWIKLY